MFLRIFISHLILAFAIVGLLFTFVYDSISTDGNGLIRILLGFLLFSFIIAIWVSAILYKNLNNPLKEIANIVQRSEIGDSRVEIKSKSYKEINYLTSALNYMLDRIKNYTDNLSIQNIELNDAFSAMEEGLVVLDSNGKIVIANEGFKRYAQSTSPEGRFYWEVIRSSEFDEMVKNIIANKAKESREITINDKILHCNGIYLKSKNEILLTFSNITEIRNIEKMKRDFVTSLSHELRTPLTSIKGYAETLEDLVDDEGKRYLEVIIRNTERLNNVVKDLLILSELEELRELDIEQVDLRSLIEDVIKVFDQKIRDKGLELKFIADENLPVIEADIFKLEQVLINIIDNAIKYTEKGEINISVKKKPDSDKVIIEIQDTGIGIPQKDLPRIFERFYVVDKSRSRKMGGTGLGLSIVKHIVLLHSGEVNVESNYGFGTKFTVILPINQNR